MNKATIRYEQGKIRQEVRIGRHQLIADHTTNEGGDDAGPTPHEFLLAALGSCTAMTLRVYAQRKNWPLENAEVTVSLDKFEGTSRFSREIKLVGPLDEGQRTRLLAVAEACPVHKTLSGKIEIVSKLL